MTKATPTSTITILGNVDFNFSILLIEVL